MAFRFLERNIERVLIPLIAVTVGAMSLILTLSLGDGVKNIIENDLSAIGNNRVLVGGGILNNDDLLLLERLPFVEYGIFPEKIKLIGNIYYRGYGKKALQAMNLPLLKEGEAVLDRDQFLGLTVGSEIELETKFGKRKFMIRGLYQEKSPFETMKMGNRVIVSDKTFEIIFGKNNYTKLVISFPKDIDAIEYIPVVLNELNKFRPGHKQIKVLEIPQIYKNIERIKSFVRKGFFTLSFISLVIGGIGILNLITVVMRERSPYIGILRTIGINQRKLIEIFFLEIVIIVSIGTFIGTILGVITSYLVGIILKIPPYFSLIKIIGIMILTMGIGVIFGILPAKRAAKLEIVEALKI